MKRITNIDDVVRSVLVYGEQGIFWMPKAPREYWPHLYEALLPHRDNQYAGAILSAIEKLTAP
jgi:hypothetical protein